MVSHTDACSDGMITDTYQQNLNAIRRQFYKNIQPTIKDMPEEEQAKIHAAFEDVAQGIAHLL